MITVQNDLILDFLKLYYPIKEINPYEKFFGYMVNDKIVGAISYSIIYERAEINYIMVEPIFRNQGIGDKLLKIVIKQCQLAKCLNITLEVKADNVTAIKLYFKNGFKKEAIRLNYYGNDDGILMRKVLR